MINYPKLKIWWDEKNNVARAWATGIVDVAEAEALLEATEKMAQEHGSKVDWLLDLSEIKKPTSKARKILVKVTAHPGIGKSAYVGASIFLRTVANFITAAAGKANARHFATEDEALKWIKEG